MGKHKIFIILVAIASVLGIAIIWATSDNIHDRRLKAYISASNKFAQIVEEEASKPAEKRDLARLEEARVEWLKAFKTNQSDHYAPDEPAKNPAYDAAYARHQSELVRARERLDKAMTDLNPEYAKQIEQREEKLEQWLKKRR